MLGKISNIPRGPRCRCLLRKAREFVFQCFSFFAPLSSLSLLKHSYLEVTRWRGWGWGGEGWTQGSREVREVCELRLREANVTQRRSLKITRQMEALMGYVWMRVGDRGRDKGGCRGLPGPLSR